MEPKTNYDVILKLRETITSRSTRKDIIKLVGEAWGHSGNAAARKSTMSAAENGIITTEAFCSIDDFLIAATAHAKTNCYFYDALKKRLLSVMQSEDVITDIHRKALIILLENNRPKDKRKQEPASYHKNLQLALCLFAVAKKTGKKFSFSSPDKLITSNSVHNNLFLLVAEATGESADCVHNAWKKNPFLLTHLRGK